MKKQIVKGLAQGVEVRLDVRKPRVEVLTLVIMGNGTA
jgi:hypothetical protein